VQAFGRQPQQAPDGTSVDYERHRPEQTTLYRLVQQHAVNLIAHTATRSYIRLPLARAVRATRSIQLRR
jgi:hypothetical protein